ncbi:conserved hypothetical protein [Cupriavidus taiwanensis]|nr:conserved hypothetical protein [Cupriavidus taiwanensis]
MPDLSASSHLTIGTGAMQANVVRGKAFTLHWNNGWGEHYKGAVTLVLRTAPNKERIETYQCDQTRSERALAQADADQLFTLKTNEVVTARP